MGLSGGILIWSSLVLTLRISKRRAKPERVSLSRSVLRLFVELARFLYLTVAHGMLESVHGIHRNRFR
jgi:hypothetical protein